MAFDPTQFGATPVSTSTPSGTGGFDPSKFGATPVATSQPAQTPSAPQGADGIWASLAAGAGNIVKGIEQPFVSLAAKPVQLLAKGLGQPDPYAKGALGGINVTAPTLKGTAGDVLKAGAEIGTVAAAPASIGGAALAGAGIGAAQGSGDALQQNQSAVDALKQGAIGGAVGGATGGALAGVGKLLSYLPNRLVQSALPKLDAANIPKVLNDTNFGTIGSMLKDSQSAVADGGSQIHQILTSAPYADNIGNGAQAITDTLHAFPNSEYTAGDVISAAKNVVPGSAALVTKLQDGTATLPEKNMLRQTIDAATKKIFTDSPQVSAQKQLAAGLASSLRTEVQSVAPETQQLFADLSKELNLRNALQATAKKLSNAKPVNLYSILSFMTGGLPAAIGEEFARSPATSIAAGKAAQALAPVAQRAAPIIGGLAGGVAGSGGNNPNQ